MIRFLVKSAVLGTLATGTLWMTVGPQQVKSWVRDGKKAVQEQIDEYQGMDRRLRKIEGEIGDLDQEIKRLKETAYKAEVEVKNLEEEVAQREEDLTGLKTNLEKAHHLLDSDMNSFRIGGINYTRGEVEGDVEAKIELYNVQQSTLAHLRETLMTHRNALTMARENVKRGEVVKVDLQSQVRLLRAKLQRFEARKVYHEAVAADFDAQEFNTDIGQCRKLISEFEDQLVVKNKLLDESLRVDPKSHVAGIDYQAPERAEDVMTRLSLILDGDSEATLVVIEDR